MGLWLRYTTSTIVAIPYVRTTILPYTATRTPYSRTARATSPARSDDAQLMPLEKSRHLSRSAQIKEQHQRLRRAEGCAVAGGSSGSSGAAGLTVVAVGDVRSRSVRGAALRMRAVAAGGEQHHARPPAHARTHAHTRTQARTHAHTHTRARTHARIHTHARTRTR